MKKGFQIEWGSLCRSSRMGRLRASLRPLLLSNAVFKSSPEGLPPAPS